MTSETVGRKGGLYCYVMTPYGEDGEVDHGALEAYVDATIAGGVDGLTCIASTCEGVYLTEAERFAVAETVCRVADGRVPVNVGVGGFSTKQAIRYAEQAQKAGAASLMTDMQTYFAISFEAAHAHYAELAKSASVPIRIYNITDPTRFDFTPDRLVRMADIGAIDSMKESSGIATRVRDIRALCGDRFAVQRRVDPAAVARHALARAQRAAARKQRHAGLPVVRRLLFGGLRRLGIRGLGLRFGLRRAP